MSDKQSAEYLGKDLGENTPLAGQGIRSLGGEKPTPEPSESWVDKGTLSGERDSGIGFPTDSGYDRRDTNFE